MATATPSRCCDGPNKQLLDRWPTHSSSWWKNGVFTLRRCKGARMSYEIVGGKERANAKKNLRRGSSRAPNTCITFVTGLRL